MVWVGSGPMDTRRDEETGMGDKTPKRPPKTKKPKAPAP
jgi:hypothetical protein